MARGLGDVLDAMLDAGRPPPCVARRILRVPLTPRSRAAAALVESVAAELARLGVSVSLELLDPGARSLFRAPAAARSAAAELTLQIATSFVLERSQSTLLVCGDVVEAAQLAAPLGSADPARELLLLECASDPAESAAIRWLLRRSGARWIASVSGSAALRASLAPAPSAAAAEAARALKSWLRASHPLEAKS
jgi:hypothetical protein